MLSLRSHRLRKNRKRLALRGVLIALTALQPVVQAASSLPSGGAFKAGSGNISSSGNVLVVNQNTLKGIIDWNTFSIGNGASVTFNNGSGATLNRVTGNVSSTILGLLSASGSIYLINPQGILIGHGAAVHTGGDFLASTLSIPAANFLSNAPLQFTGGSSATVVNLGDLASTGGSIYLIGRSVQNGGSISTPKGTTGLGAGSEVVITDSSTGQKVAVQSPGGDVINSGFINAAQAELKANGGNIYALAGNSGGQINATGTATQGGHVWLVATNGTTNVSGLISARNVDGTGGTVETSGSHVVTTNSEIKTGRGGTWLLDPDDLTIDSTLAGTIDATLNGGTNVTEQTSAPTSGGFGDITLASPIAWTGAASLTLSAYRNVALNAGISNAGSGSLTVRADNTATGTGTVSGTGLIDFSNSTGNVAILYNPAVFGTPDYSPNFGAVSSSWMAPSDGSVSSQYTAYMLVNSAANLQNLDINAAGTYALGRDIDLSSITNFVPLGSASPYFTGILDGMGHTISNLSINDSGGGLVGMFAQIGSLGQVRNVNFAAASIGESGTNGNEVGVLVGRNDGTISNASVAGVINSTSFSAEVGGMAGRNTGTIQGSQSSVSLTLTTGANYVGGLVGDNEGPINNSHATVLIPTGEYAGGLAGSSSAPITNSWASGQVSDNEGSSYIGGLVGYNDTGGTIMTSFATGDVSSTSAIQAGGLAGYSTAAIIGSHATGAVSCAASGCATGGLVGYSDIGGTIDTSHATGAVTGAGDAPIGGLVGNSKDTITNSWATGNVTDSGGGSGYVGGLVGHNAGAITGSYATGSATAGDNVDNTPMVGGLAGYSSGTISTSYATGGITGGAGSEAGGLVGYSNAAISGSHASGTVTVGNSNDLGNPYAGGLVGYSDAGGTISGSHATGSVSGGTTATVGGLVGQSAAAVDTSYALGSVTCTANCSVGGLVGASTADISVSYAMGAVTGGAGTDAGGLVGDATGGTIFDTYARGAVTQSAGGGDAGGLIAFSNVTLTRSYSSGLVTGLNNGTSYSGAFMGNNSGTVTYSYFDSNVNTLSGTGHGDSAGIFASLVLQNGTMPAGFNPVDHVVWLAPAGVYPYFSTQGPLVTISGTAYNGASAISSAGVSALSDGFVLANLITNSGGFYTVSEPQNLVQGGVLTYLTSNGVANTFSDGAPNADVYNFTNMDLHVGTLTLLNKANTTLSGLNAALSATLGANSGSNFLFTVPSGQLSMSPAANLSIASSATSFTVDQTLSTTGNILINSTGNLTVAASNSITSGTGDNITLVTAGAFTNNGGANALSVSGGGNWLVYSQNLANDTTGGLAEDFIQYNATYGVTSPAQSGNGFLYVLAPMITPSLTGTVSKTYDGTSAASVPAANLTFTGNVSGDTVTLNPGSAAYSSPNVGSSIDVTVTGSTVASAFKGSIPVYGYQVAPSVTGAIGTINPAILTYTSDAASQTYGSVNSSYTGSVTGLVGNDTLLGATTGSAVFTSPATATSGVGTYAINGSGLSAGNYIFAQAPSNASALTINPATLTYLANSATQTYGSTNGTYTGTVTGFVNNETLSSATAGTAVFTSLATATSGVGSYAINGSGLSAGNYVFAQAPSNASALTINPATLTYLANTATQTYGSTNGSYTGTVTGFVNNETLSGATTGAFAFTSPASATSNVGTYAINGSGLAAPNYTFVQASSNASALTINPATLTYIADSATRAAGTNNPVFTGSVAGFVNNQSLSSATTGTAVFASPADANSSPGNYAINGSGLSANYGNYIFTQAPGNATALTVTNAILPPIPTPTPTPTPTPAPILGSTPITITVNNATALDNQFVPNFSSTYNGPAISGLSTTALLAGLTYQIVPTPSGPGTYQIIASGAAPAGYVFNVVPGTLTVVDSTPTTLPTQARLFAPEVPVLIGKPEGEGPENLLSPLNSIGLFQIDVSSVNNNSFGSSPFNPSSQQPALAQSLFFGDGAEKSTTHVAGVKP